MKKGVKMFDVDKHRFLPIPSNKGTHFWRWLKTTRKKERRKEPEAGSINLLDSVT